MKTDYSKKGVTLAEIVIVLAVVAIMSTMVVSFSLACNLWVQQGINRQNTLSAFNTVKSGIKAYSSSFDDENHIFGADGAKLYIKDVSAPDETVYYLTFSDGALVGTSPSGDIVYPADNISGITFSVVAGESGNAMLYCSVNYSIPSVSADRPPESGSYNVVIALRVAAAQG